MTLTISSLSLAVSNFALCPHFSHFHRCGLLPNSPHQDPPHLLPGSREKTQRDKKIIWTKRRDALGFGLQPPCQRAKITDCPSVSTISICLRLRPASAGAKVEEPSRCVNLSEQNYTSLRKQRLKVKQKGIGLRLYRRSGKKTTISILQS